MSQELLPIPKQNKKGTPPPVETTATANTDNLSRVDPTAIVLVNFRCPQAKKMEMVTYAKERGTSVTEVLIKAFDEYKERNA